MKNRVKQVIALTALTFVSASQAQGTGAQDGPQHLPSIQLGAGMFNIQTEVALTEQQREIGLMHRTSLGPYQGMLFVFDAPAKQCFWMKNTLIPLSVAFVANDGTIINIDEMKPQTLDPHCSAQPVRFVLEMSEGWFAKRGMKAGSKLTGKPFGTGQP
ncbi:DUF192 domain-containing protein [Aquabacterium sp.]|uniref:DUF192 domain-containing protein n=1 Tax=Aquabacterium sp. TaxID=1872578 RepID=UPI0035ADB8F8